MRQLCVIVAGRQASERCETPIARYAASSERAQVSEDSGWRAAEHICPGQSLFCLLTGADRLNRIASRAEYTDSARVRPMLITRNAGAADLPLSGCNSTAISL